MPASAPRRRGVHDGQCVCDFRSGLTASLTTNIVASASIDLPVLAAYEAETGVSFVCAVFDRLAAAFEDNDVVALLEQ